MAITVHERYRGIEFTDTAGSVEYLIHGTGNENEALEALKAEAPENWPKPLLARGVPRVEEFAPFSWLGVVPYGETSTGFGTAEPIPQGTAIYDGRTGLENVRQRVGEEKKKFPLDAEDSGGLLGVNADGQVEGIDVPVPVTHFGFSFTLPNTSISFAYQKALEQLTGSVNAAPFQNRDVKSVMFLGPSYRVTYGRKRETEITLNFKAGINRLGTNGVKIGNLGPVDKYAFEVLDQRVETVEGQTKTIEKLVALYVFEVWPHVPRDWTALRIP